MKVEAPISARRRWLVGDLQFTTVLRRYSRSKRNMAERHVVVTGDGVGRYNSMMTAFLMELMGGHDETAHASRRPACVLPLDRRG